MAEMKIDITDVIERAVEKLEAEGYTVQKWIPCSERLPEQWHNVIVQFRCGKDTAISTARRTHSGSWIVDFLRYADKECITIQAWMPMPDAYEPPESEVHGDAAEKP